MTSNTHPFRSLLLTAGLLAAASAIGATNANDAAGLSIWRDPAFQKDFLGSYGMRADVEPRVTPAELQLLEQVRLLMAEGGDGGLEKARALLEKNITPLSTALYEFTLGNLALQQERYDDAAAWFERAIAKHPHFLRAQKNLGVAAIRANAFARAIPPLTRAIALGAADGLTFGLLAHAYAMNDQPLAAEGAYRQAMMLQPETLDWQLGLARCLFKQRQYAEAAALCGELLRRDPERADYWVLQANAWLGLKQPMQAAVNYELLDRAGRAAPAILNALGDIYVNEGALDLAADAYRRALEKDPAAANPALFLRDAEVLAARGASDAAGRLLDRAQALCGDRFGAEENKRQLKLRARLAAAEGRAAEEQAALLEKLAALDPLDGEALLLLARHEASRNNLEKACFLFERVEGMEKFEAEARLRHGQTLVRAGRYAEAVPLLKRAQELRPRDDVARYLEQVERAARARGQ
jgi:tetratricopeptide (TPR) repeat protein